MRHVTIALPDELSEALAAPGQDLSRAAFEALALAAYRERKISAAQLRQLLGYETRMEVVREALRRMEDEDDRALRLASPPQRTFSPTLLRAGPGRDLLLLGHSGASGGSQARTR
jgi:chromosome segregation and condensation protein ScpB